MANTNIIQNNPEFQDIFNVLLGIVEKMGELIITLKEIFLDLSNALSIEFNNKLNILILLLENKQRNLQYFIQKESDVFLQKMNNSLCV